MKYLQLERGWYEVKRLSAYPKQESGIMWRKRRAATRISSRKQMPKTTPSATFAGFGPRESELEVGVTADSETRGKNKKCNRVQVSKNTRARMSW